MTTNPSKATAGPQETSADINAIPTSETLTAAWNVLVRDRTGKETSFGEAVAGPDVAPRVLVIFIRHWFCPVSISCHLRLELDQLKG